MADTDIRALVESKTPDLEGLLSGSGLTVERFKATVFQLLDQDYELRKATSSSILSGVMAVADVGLTFTKTLGHAYLVKYGNSAVPIIGARGLTHLALKSGAALDIRTGIRREGEHFRYRPLHPTEPIQHEPLAAYDEEGNYAGDAASSHAKAIGYYAVAFLPGGLVRAEYMDVAAVERHRDKYSKAANNGPWKTDFDEMAKKTLVRKLCKYMRLSGQLEKAVHVSDSIDASLGNDDDLPADNLPHGDPAPDPKPARTDTLKLTPDNAPASDAQQAEVIVAVKKAGVRVTDFAQWAEANIGAEFAMDIDDLRANQVPTVLDALKGFSNA